jgi:hypothetical protein
VVNLEINETARLAESVRGGSFKRLVTAMQKYSFEKRIKRMERASGCNRQLSLIPFSPRKPHLPLKQLVTSKGDTCHVANGPNGYALFGEMAGMRDIQRKMLEWIETSVTAYSGSGAALELLVNYSR